MTLDPNTSNKKKAAKQPKPAPKTPELVSEHGQGGGSAPPPPPPQADSGPQLVSEHGQGGGSAPPPPPPQADSGPQLVSEHGQGGGSATPAEIQPTSTAQAPPTELVSEHGNAATLATVQPQAASGPQAMKETTALQETRVSQAAQPLTTPSLRDATGGYGLTVGAQSSPAFPPSMRDATGGYGPTVGAASPPSLRDATGGYGPTVGVPPSSASLADTQPQHASTAYNPPSNGNAMDTGGRSLTDASNGATSSALSLSPQASNAQRFDIASREAAPGYSGRLASGQLRESRRDQAGGDRGRVLLDAESRRPIVRKSHRAVAHMIDRPTPRPFTPVEERNVVADAARFVLGVPYSWGAGDQYGATYGQPTGEHPYQATHTEGFDCSGLVVYSYAQIGITLPHYSGAGGQFSAGTPVTGALRVGDLVFFDGSSNPQHVGIYIGSGKFIEAPYTGANVRISVLADQRDYVGARRLIP